MVLFKALLRIYILRVEQTTSVGAIAFITSHRDTPADLLFHPVYDITICYFLSQSQENTCKSSTLCNYCFSAFLGLSWQQQEILNDV